MTMFNNMAFAALSLLTLSFSHSAMGVEYTLRYNTWELISLSEVLPANRDTPRTIFEEAILAANPQATYERDWIMYSYDAAVVENNGYEVAPLDNRVEAGKGYWIIQAANSKFMVDVLVVLNAVSGPVHEIGDEGPAGGIVFYVTDDGLHGLEAAPEDQGNVEWGCLGSLIVGGTHTSLGSGKLNTQLIVNQCGDGTAAVLAKNYDLGGYFDWYLPSLDELNLMYQNLHLVGLGNFAINREYWSSVEFSAFGARTKSFLSGDQSTENASNPLLVRAVRAF